MKNWVKSFAIIIICFLGIIIYSNTFSVPFSLDDPPHIVGNTSIRNIYNLHNIWDFWPSRFITYLSIALNYHFNGTDVFGYHLFNLVVHLGAAVLVWWLVLLIFSTPAMKEEKISRHANLIALFAGLIFVAHPIQTEAVTYIIQRAASMATLFYLASLCLYVKSRLVEENRGYYYIASVITAVLAMLCKEIAITLPLMIVLYEFSFLRTKGGMNWKYLTPFFLTLFIIPLATIYPGAAELQHWRAEPGISSMHYFLTQLRVMVTYIRLVFLPLNQNLDYDYPVFKSIFEIPVLMSFLFLGTILFFAKRLFSKYRLVSFSICWFFLTLLPESSFFPIKDVIFEHRLYLPMVGYALFLVSLIFYLFKEKNIFIIKILLILIVGWYAFLTYNRNSIWQDKVNLWSDVIKKSPGKARPYFDRSDAYQDKGDIRDARIDYKKALSITPDFASAYNSRAFYYENQDAWDQAIIEHTKSINIDPGDALAYFKRGDDYLLAGKLDQAMPDFVKAARLNPNLVEIHYSLAVLYYLKGDYTRAWESLHKAIASGCKIDPKFVEELKKAGGSRI